MSGLEFVIEERGSSFENLPIFERMAWSSQENNSEALGPVQMATA